MGCKVGTQNKCCCQTWGEFLELDNFVLVGRDAQLPTRIASPETKAPASDTP